MYSQLENDLFACKEQLTKISVVLLNINKNTYSKTQYCNNMLINAQKDVEQLVGSLNTLLVSGEMNPNFKQTFRRIELPSVPFNKIFTTDGDDNENNSSSSHNATSRTPTPISCKTPEIPEIPKITSILSRGQIEGNEIQGSENEMTSEQIEIADRIAIDALIKEFSEIDHSATELSNNQNEFIRVENKRRNLERNYHEIELRDGMYLSNLDNNLIEKQIQNIEEFANIKFFHRNPNVYNGCNGLYKYTKAKSGDVYHIADNGLLYKYDINNNLKPAISYKKLQCWKEKAIV